MLSIVSQLYLNNNLLCVGGSVTHCNKDQNDKIEAVFTSFVKLLLNHCHLIVQSHSFIL